MDKLWMGRQLPEQPPDGLVDWAVKRHGQQELGGEFCIYNSERVKVDGKTQWAAYCTCTACLEDFITQKEPGGNAIRLIVGDDGSYYTVEPGDDVDPYMSIEVNREGDKFYCPLCGNEVELIHKGNLRGGRTKRIMIVSVQNVEGYTAVIYWLVHRNLDEDGINSYGATAEEAYVLSETGTLIRYTHVHRCGAFYGANRSYLPEWKLMNSNEDVIERAYADWRSINNKKVGADFYPVYPDLEGTTGEKTALIQYLQAEGCWPVAYLKWWRRRRSIENLCRQGQARLVAQIISHAYRFSYGMESEAEKYIDTSKRKPHEMLGMSREEFRFLRENGLEWTTILASRWKRYKDHCGGRLLLTEFVMLEQEFLGGMDAALDLMRLYGDTDLDKLARYLRKGGLRPNEVQILLDTRNAYKKLYDRSLTSEELWPKHLQDAHDRAYQMLRERRDKEEADKLRLGFNKTRDAYAHLEWTDGELDVILPKNNGELVYEGDVLRHCVGGYGNQHINGTSVIFFIRRHRRPERPYYTLAIDMTGIPRERQLHGYGNERHGPNKQYSHRIPKKVRAFCTRWEKEILLAWYAEKQRNKEKTA